ncbi:Pseudouridine synthase [Thiomonas sp. X19]|uniref:23S rRNA pseudouridine(2605) synthase RluB n=1 Tax=Thiomonas sp. X19 TaxID=1050370 RepID=UPI000B73FE74|nr:pseudouridine synthase [Thiomonas sp. X19]SCC94631.1 Pseudouridine synthase [Thiomonas sp. X19]
MQHDESISDADASSNPATPVVAEPAPQRPARRRKAVAVEAAAPAHDEGESTQSARSEPHSIASPGNAAPSVDPVAAEGSAEGTSPQAGQTAGDDMTPRDAPRRRKRKAPGPSLAETETRPTGSVVPEAQQTAPAEAQHDADGNQAQPERSARADRPNRPDRPRQNQNQRKKKHNSPLRGPAKNVPAVRIEEVISGDFDRAVEIAEAAEPGARRVLPPSPEAPKLHKVLAQAGVGSRREMEQLIVDGLVSVNGEPAHLGQRIQPGDQIRVNGKPLKFRISPPPARVLVYHKPVGEVVTFKDPEGRPTVFRNLPRVQNAKWTAIGRLDINTEGLLLFTTSGELANKLMHPSQGVEREYAVRVLGQVDDPARQKLLGGVDLSDGPARFMSLEEAGGEGANRWYRVIIAEGRNREVRRLFEAVGLTVSRLIRVRYGSIALPAGLRRGDFAEIEREDVKAMMNHSGTVQGLDDRSKGQKPGGNGANGVNGQSQRKPGGRNDKRQESRGQAGRNDGRNQDRPEGPPGGRGNAERGGPSGEREPGPNSYAMSAVDALFGRATREARRAAPRHEHDDRQLPEREPGPNSYAMSAVDALFGKGAGGHGGNNKPRSARGGKKGGSGGQPDPMRSALGQGFGQGPRAGPGPGGKRRNFPR